MERVRQVNTYSISLRKKKKKDEMVQYVINCSHVCSLNSLWALDH